MNCPACNRNLALTLSVCPSCGTMVNDSVREELALKISPLAKPLKTSLPAREKPVLEKPAAPVEIKPVEINLSVEPIEPIEPIQPPAAPALPAANLQTTQITAKHTSPILVEFQTKKAVVPEWRLQLQNSVRRRNGSGNAHTADAVGATSYQKVLVTSGATALKVEPVERTETAVSANPTLENALRRIEQSRQKYLAEEKPKLSVVAPPQAKSLPVNVPVKPVEVVLPKTEIVSEPAAPVKAKSPISFNALKFEKFDTNKLPPLPIKVATTFEKAIEIQPEETEIVAEENNVLHIEAAETPDVLAYQETADEISEAEGDDRAPMIARFNAGFFDLIIGSFLSLILLAPFTLANGNLFTFQGLLAFLATTSIVMFIYLTTTVGMMGRTLGMRLFSLELIDIEENAYPTFHQAAVSSSVYLVSLALGGVGFLTLFLNDEKRAAHDLVSGTIVVKEYE